MIKAFHIGRTGAAEHQRKMEITANNLANVNTDGFKASNATFQELLHQRMRMPNDYESRPGVYEQRQRFNTRNWNNFAPPPIFDEDGEFIFQHYPGNMFTENRLRVGSGARMSENALVMTQGNLMRTGHALTAALTDPRAFFAVENPHDPFGEMPVLFTRAGAFALSMEDGLIYLVTTAGEYVLDEHLQRILVSPDMSISNLRLVAHGYPVAIPVPDPDIIRIGVFTLDPNQDPELLSNIFGLAQIGGNRFTTTEFSGAMSPMDNPPDGIIRQFYMEASNVSIADEMVKVIQAQRAFQSNLTVIRTADEIATTVNQLNAGQ